VDQKEPDAKEAVIERGDDLSKRELEIFGAKPSICHRIGMQINANARDAGPTGEES